MKLSIKTIVTGPFQENTYLLIDKLSDKCILLDPGDEGQKIINYINENDLIPIAIINTHAHLDHIGAIAEIKEKYSIPFYLHVDEKPILDSFPIACRMYGIKKGNSPSVDKWINSSGDLVIGPFNLSIIETPGHTPGGCSYLINNVILKIENEYNVKSTFFFLNESIKFDLLNLSNWSKSLGRYKFTDE